MFDPVKDGGAHSIQYITGISPFATPIAALPKTTSVARPQHIIAQLFIWSYQHLRLLIYHISFFIDLR